MNLDHWAKRWGIAPEALNDLRRMFINVELVNHDKRKVANSEADVMSNVRIEALHKGIQLFRNNVGATYTAKGAFLRYGLANDSKALNTELKSADLIGIRPVKITRVMVGDTIGQFVSREIKRPDWRYSDTDRERAQLRWAELVTSLGGDACFATGEGTL